MMSSPEYFYESTLQGKSADEIMKVIRRLKREFGRLRAILEHPDYMCEIEPGEDVQIQMTREYLERAKQALEEAGGEYVPTPKEQKAMEFDNALDQVSRVIFDYGGFTIGREITTFTVRGDRVHIDVDNTLCCKPSNLDDSNTDIMDKAYFVSALKDLHIGEWRRHYNTRRFGMVILDGVQWELTIEFSDGRKAHRVSGDNAYPYNFEKLRELAEPEYM